MMWVTADFVAERSLRRWIERGKVLARDTGAFQNGKPRREVLLESLPAHIQQRYYASLGGAELRPLPQGGDGDGIPAESNLRSVSPSPIPSDAGNPLAGLSESELNKIKKIAEALDQVEGASRQKLTGLARELGLSVSTLQRKAAAFRENGLAGLVRQKRKDRGQTRAYDAKMIALIQSQYLQPYRPTVASIYRAVVKECEMSGIEAPSYGWVRAQVKKLPPDMVSRFRIGEKDWDDKFAFVSLRRKPPLPRQWVDADHHPCDHYVVFPDGKIGRPWMTAFQDLCTNEILAFLLSKEKPVGKGTYPGSASIGLGLREAILKRHSSEWPSYGLFDHLYVDLGKDFRSQYVRAVCADLGIEIVHTRGYHGKSKPIERWFGVMETQTRHLPGWCGSSPADNPERQKIKPEKLDPKKLLTIDEYESALRQWLLTDFHHASSKALKGLSPLEALAEHTQRGWCAREVHNERVFDLLLMQRRGKPAKVHRYGVMLFGRPFFAPELLDYIGQQVDEVRYDPDRLGEIYIYNDGRFICTATNREFLEYGANKEMLKRDQEIKREQNRRKAEHYDDIVKQAQYKDPLARAAAEQRHEEVMQEERQKLAVNATPESKVKVVLPKYAGTMKAVSGKRKKKTEAAEAAEKPRPSWDVEEPLPTSEELFPEFHNPNPWLKED